MKLKKEEKIQLELDEHYLPTLVNALEVYSRLRCGQIKYALDSAFIDKNLDYTEMMYLENIVRSFVFKNEEILEYNNMYYGIHSKEAGDAKEAFAIKKTIEQYLHYQRNNGYRKICDVSGDGPMKAMSKYPVPKVVGFEPKKVFPIPKRQHAKLDFFFEIKDFSSMWKIIDKTFTKKPLPKGTSSEIKKIDDKWLVVVNEPYLIE
jgi:hypothetical protein